MDSVDAGLLVLRVFLGFLMVAHGIQKLFGWFNGHGVQGTGGYFTSIGYPAGTLLAVGVGVVEAGGGAAIAAGLFTPLVSLAFVSLFVNSPGRDTPTRSGTTTSRTGSSFRSCSASCALSSP